MRHDPSEADGPQQTQAASVPPSTPSSGASGDLSIFGYAMMQLNVTGMHCFRCQEKVTGVVAPLAGVKEVEVDFNSGTVSVLYDPGKADPPAFAAAVRDAGYTVNSITQLGTPRSDD